jgi:hypothetical protein
MYHANLCPAGMHKHGGRCTDLLQTTIKELTDSVAIVMFLAAQKGNLELSIKQAVAW